MAETGHLPLPASMAVPVAPDQKEMELVAAAFEAEAERISASSANTGKWSKPNWHTSGGVGGGGVNSVLSSNSGASTSTGASVPLAPYRVRLFDAIRDALYSAPLIPSLDLLRIISQYLEVRDRLVVWQKEALHQIELEVNCFGDAGRVTECRLISLRPADYDRFDHTATVPLVLSMKRITTQSYGTGSGDCSGSGSGGDGPDHTGRFVVSVKSQFSRIRILKSSLPADDNGDTTTTTGINTPGSDGSGEGGGDGGGGILCELMIPGADLSLFTIAEYVGIQPIHLSVNSLPPILSSPIRAGSAEALIGSIFLVSSHTLPAKPDTWYTRAHRLDIFGAVYRPDFTASDNPAPDTVVRTELADPPTNRTQPGLAYNSVAHSVYMTCGTDESGADIKTPTAAMHNARYSIAQNTWSLLPSAPSLRRKHLSCLYHSHLVVASGYWNAISVDAVEALPLDPASGDAIDGATTKWETWPQLPAPIKGYRMCDSMGVFNDRLYVSWNEEVSAALQICVFALVWADGKTTPGDVTKRVDASTCDTATASSDRSRHGEWKQLTSFDGRGLLVRSLVDPETSYIRGETSEFSFGRETPSIGGAYKHLLVV